MAHLMNSVNDELLQAYFFYSGILVLKLLAMSILTASQRFKHKAYVNTEDAGPMKIKPKVDDNVERVRRAHLNDLENIPVFFVAAFIYMMTNPSVTFATLLFKAFTIARIGHTFVYAVYVVPQPARGIAWAVGYFITGYMAIRTFANPEDVKTLKLKVSVNDNVERVRRAHLNDLENILPFFVVAFAYISTNPSLACALTLFRAFTLARFAHTFVYAVYVVPQPARAASWFVGYLVTGYMAYRTVTHYM